MTLDNDSTDRIIGRFQAYHEGIIKRIDVLEIKIDSLQSFKWKIMGIASLFTFLTTLVVEFVRH